MMGLMGQYRKIDFFSRPAQGRGRKICFLPFEPKNSPAAFPRFRNFFPPPESIRSCSFRPRNPVVEFSKLLNMVLDRPVVDKTGLTGRFDIHLEFARDEVTPGLSGPGPDGPAAVASDPNSLG